MDPTNIEGSPLATKKAINELHFNAIQNNYNSYPRHPSSASDDNRKLLPATPTRKFVVVPTASSNINNGTLSISSNTNNNNHSHQNEYLKRSNTKSGESSSSGPSSSVTSPIMSPTPSSSLSYHKPRHYNSMRSIRSGM
jgi:hypothetical protein